MTLDHLDLAVANAGTPRAVGPPPAAAVARRIAARHADRQTQRRNTDRTPFCCRPVARHPSAYSSSINATRYRNRSTDIDVARTFGGVDALHRYSAASNSSRCRRAASTSTIVAPRNPPRSSTSIAKQPAATPDHAPTTCRHPFRAGIAVPARPLCRSAHLDIPPAGRCARPALRATCTVPQVPAPACAGRLHSVSRLTNSEGCVETDLDLSLRATW